MVHLVTSMQGLARAISWLEPDDLVILMGSAKGQIRSVSELPCPIKVLRLPDSITPRIEEEISISAFAQKLISAKSRTWS